MQITNTRGAKKHRKKNKKLFSNKLKRAKKNIYPDLAHDMTRNFKIASNTFCF